MDNGVIEKSKKKNKKAKSKLISFDEELVPKHVADKILASEETSSQSTSKQPKQKKRKKSNHEEESLNKEDIPENGQAVKTLTKQKRPKCDVEDLGKKKKKKKKRNAVPESTGEDANDEQDLNASSESTSAKYDAESSDKKKKKKRNATPESTLQDVNEEQQDLNVSSKAEKKESIRAQKRKRYAKLLEEKKLKTEVLLQEKGLNYLSKWKHSREEWKFEKLRQIWLQHNMYDPDKVPQEFWDDLIEYFGNSKGKARDIILKDALKLIEENPEAEDDTKIKRARDIVQNLQE